MAVSTGYISVDTTGFAAGVWRKPGDGQTVAGLTATECVSFAGFFKPGAPPQRREEVKALFERSSRGLNGTTSLVEGKNSLVFMQGASSAKRPATDGGCGGMCLVSRRGPGERASAEKVIESIEALSGSFALADIDDERAVVLGRDFAGAQSVYFCLIDGGLLFASSLSWFKGFGLAISNQGVADFLHFLYIPAPGTIYKDVEAVLPGEAVCFDGKNITKRALGRRKVNGAQPAGAGKTPEEFLGRYERLLEKSVRGACPKDSKAVLLLSGGKDSSSLAVAASLGKLNNIEAVTLGFHDSAIDETEDARTVAGHLGIPFTAMKFTAEEYFDLLPGYAACLGQPLGDAAAMPLYAAVKKLSGRYDLFIDGTGNDRYFGIPTTWQEDVAWQAHRCLPGLDRLPWSALAAGLSYSFDSISRSLGRRREEQFVSWKGFSARELEALTGMRPDWSARGVYRIYESSSSAMDHKTRTLCEIWEPEAAYRKAVQTANFHGKTVRYPFLDADLVDYSEGLPVGLRSSGRTNKIIIRMLLQKYLPVSALSKRKGAFHFPKGYILDTNGFEHVRRLLSKEALLRHGLVEPAAATACVDGYTKGDRGLQDRVWALLLLHAWMEFGR